jgi:hypothetical protein
VAKATARRGQPPNANRAAETMIAIERAAAMQGRSAAEKPAMATGAMAMRAVMPIVHGTQIGHEMQIGREMRIGREMAAARDAPSDCAARSGRVTSFGGVDPLVPWAGRASETLARCLAGLIWTATTCSIGASLPSYRNSSSVVGRDRRAVLMARASVDEAQTGHSGGEAIGLKTVCANGVASTVRQVQAVPDRASATTAARATASGPVHRVRVVEVTRLEAQMPARP